MISQEEALSKILDRVQPLAGREVLLADALGCFAGQDLVARLSLPPFDNSAMDGYAIIASSCTAGTRLKVVGEQAAGIDQRLRVEPGQAVRIFTGAPIPAGADAVVMQEEVSRVESEIILQARVEPGEFVRRRGGDITEGQRILAAGDRITPQMIALLAAQGISSIRVGGEVRAAIVSTGDELIAPGAELKTGQIYDANTELLRALLQTCGVTLASVIHCADEPKEVEGAIRVGTKCDVLVVTGGVSVGARDFVKEAITAAGGALDLWRVAVKPGKPFLFGRAGACAIFGLPGNPVSAFVTFLLFVRPALLRLMGANEDALQLPVRRARLETEMQNPGDRPHYVRGVLNDDTFRVIGRQESHALYGLSRSNALLLVPPRETLPAGALVAVLTWD